MGALQVCLSDVRAPVGATGRSAKRKSIDLGVAGRFNSGRPAAACGPVEEWAVVRRAIAGDTDAQESLFARHTDKLYRTAFAVLHNKEDAEDALQDGFCRAYTSLCSFQGRSSFSSWLTRIIINSALMTLRRRRAHSETSLDEILESQAGHFPYGVVDPRLDPERLCVAIEIEALIAKHVRRLPRALRQAFRLGAIHRLSDIESRHALNIPVSTFKSRKHRARLKLACGLRQSFKTPSERIGVRKERGI
jgi:RNA polymerase sigma-70 factor (ECF subfamily)